MDFRTFDLPAAPQIPGLVFRLFRGEADYPAIDHIQQAVKQVDGDIWMKTRADFSARDCATTNPFEDCLFVEINGEVIGYSWIDWWTESNGIQLYLLLGWILPEWRRKGIGRTLLHWQEQRARQIAATQAPSECRMFGANVDETQPAALAFFLGEDYRLAFTVVDLQRLLSEPLQLAPLPAGVELRPVTPEQYPAIYELNEATFRESNNGYTEQSYEEFLQDVIKPTTDTSLWCIAWEGEQVVGLVINEIVDGSGKTPWVAVRKDWRRRGLGRALMTHSLQRFQEREIQLASLTTILESISNAVGLYERVGYRIVKRMPRYRKPM
ncbi:putative acetyltransferase, GNAT [Dictyobacter vulcani]|uniref:Putative acetyltransferase, GNAT n=1 Tax=Dictyobacter vulcani TaxID=2607529 RepID=A0A5J4KR50_9CHLR|nr:GNAT family N-acetyltransferase [Dictyobacter vulcani]GER90365.1 putative acetyltransferase, GNAT [Dictyobacter vulcani]